MIASRQSQFERKVKKSNIFFGQKHFIHKIFPNVYISSHYNLRISQNSPSFLAISYIKPKRVHLTAISKLHKIQRFFSTPRHFAQIFIFSIFSARFGTIFTVFAPRVEQTSTATDPRRFRLPPTRF